LSLDDFSSSAIWLHRHFSFSPSFSVIITHPSEIRKLPQLATPYPAGPGDPSQNAAPGLFAQLP
jgi:hypothetical protein